MSVVAILLTLASGGVAGAFAANALTHRRERLAHRREEQASQWLITLEVANANRGAQNILEGEVYTAFPTSAWEDERQRLARGLPTEAFLVLSGTYNAIHGFNWRYESKVFQADDRDHEQLFRAAERMRDSTKVALQMLEDLR